MPRFNFEHTYARDVPGTYAPAQPAPARAPRLLYLNEPLADELRLDVATLQGPSGAALWAGNTLPDDAQPIAQAYAGHQFGHFSPRLGDGRALLLGEVIDRHGRRRDIAFKGSGRTPFSRGGDGRAAVGPMLREVLIGEAMHALGIPTTRALAVAATGEVVVRERPMPGAVLTRVAASHLRVGSFQYLAAQGDLVRLRQLVDHAVARHDPALLDTAGPARCLGLLRAVADRQAVLLAQWLNVGFIHGVMNTDNMTISGETIDYGPCAFMEAYDPAAVFSSIDHGGRYAYANQPLIARWNLARLAEALMPLMAASDDEAAIEAAVAQATAVIDDFVPTHARALLRGQRAKLGLSTPPASAASAASDLDAPDDVHAEGDTALVADWLAMLQQQSVDFTLAWRRLADAAEGQAEPLRDQFADRAALDGWLDRWRARLALDDAAQAASGTAPHSAHRAAPSADRAARMRRASPWIIPRNHLVEAALAAATNDDDLAPFQRLLGALAQPFDERPAFADFAEPAPHAVTAAYQTFCGT